MPTIRLVPLDLRWTILSRRWDTPKSCHILVLLADNQWCSSLFPLLSSLGCPLLETSFSCVCCHHGLEVPSRHVAMRAIMMNSRAPMGQSSVITSPRIVWPILCSRGTHLLGLFPFGAPWSDVVTDIAEAVTGDFLVASCIPCERHCTKLWDKISP